MRILVVGAGALGSTFGFLLNRGGARIDYLVRPGNGTPREIRLAELRRFRAPRLVAFRPEAFHHEAQQISGRWDMVLLCTHSSTLAQPWVGQLRDRVGDAVIVTIGMAIDDRAKLEGWWPAEQIVEILPSILAFVPETAAQGAGSANIAYWIAPGPLAVSGSSPDRVATVVAALRAGGVAARFRKAGTGATFMSAVNVPLAVAAELWGWDGRNDRINSLALEAAREATVISAAQAGTKPPRLPSAFSVGLAARLFRFAAPFDTGRFTRTNYSKVAGQTLEMLDAWINAARARGLKAGALGALRAALIEQRATSAE